ncbi:MAG: hypothetical protein HRT62_13755 [Epibacterium sp.]|nr:hypothetical protein [Epibacterium sp.]
MARNNLLLQRSGFHRPERNHDGKVILMRSNFCWCSDGLEFACWNGDVIRAAFLIDAHDREIIFWRAVANAGTRRSIESKLAMTHPPKQDESQNRACGNPPGYSRQRQRCNYSVPVAYGDREVWIEGFVGRVVIDCATGVIADYLASMTVAMWCLTPCITCV